MRLISVRSTAITAAIALSVGIFLPLSASAVPILDCPDATVLRSAASHGSPPFITPPDWSNETTAVCYAVLAEEVRETDTYRAETLFVQAVELAPRNPAVVEAIARFYRIFRGSRGLFAESEDYYLRARDAIEDALGVARESDPASVERLEELREKIIRGRIELNKREGLGLFIPSEPGDALGIYLGIGIEYGQVPVAHNDLATWARGLLNKFSNFDTRNMLREPDRFYQRYRLRARYGRLPYVDLAWSELDQSDAIASGEPPVEFFDFDMNNWEFALEDSVGFAPVGDLFWRLEYRRSKADPEGFPSDTIDRGTVSTTLTRSFGRVKADLDLLGSFATVDVDPRQEDYPRRKDRERTYAATLRLLHFPELKTMERRVIDPRGYEYLLGAVHHSREWDAVDQFQDTFFGGVKLAEVVPRTDLQVLTNYFRNNIKGESGKDSSDVEINLIVSYRIIDLVNDMEFRQADRRVGLAQWLVSLRLFEDISTGSLDDFESRGAVVSSSVELFSGPLNRSTAILEPIYEVRHYHHRNRVQHMFRLLFRLGF
jgi:hypothetical protein